MKSEIRLTIAIDGPAGAGKSTVAKMVAKALDFTYVDSGAVYRALTWKVLEQGINLDDEEAIIKTAKELNLKIKGSSVIVDSKDISLAIRDPGIDRAISDVCQIKGVRDYVVCILRQIGSKGGLVMEGRDIGTVVFPEAEVKIYLDATAQERSWRRYKEFKQRGIDVDRLKLQEEIERRDNRDKNRQIGPLTKAQDALYIDTTALTLEEVSLIILRYYKSVLAKDGSNWLYCFVCILIWFLTKTLFRLKVRGQGNVPLTGGVLVACNHLSYIDPVVLGFALPRMANYMAKANLFDYPIFGWFLRQVNAHPIKQEGMDRAAFEKVDQILASDRLVVIFPEGTRSPSGQLQAGKPGVGLMIVKALERCPKLKVIPAKLIGTNHVLPVHAKWLRIAPIEVRFGPPIDLNKLEIKRSKESYHAITETIMEKIHQL